MTGPRNIVEALACVMDELPAIGRDERASQAQGGYAYRGIEQITREVQGLFAKYRIVLVPRVESWEIRPVEVGGKPWTDTILVVSYQVWASGDQFAELGPAVEGHNVLTVGPFVGIGRDGADKGANKCMTQCMKYLLLQLLCISDGKDDADKQTHEAGGVGPVGAVPATSGDVVDAQMQLIKRVQALTMLEDDNYKNWLAAEGLPKRARDMDAGQVAAAMAWLDAPRDTPTSPERNPGASLHNLTDDERETALVGAMKPAALRDMLIQRSLDTSGSEQAQRNRLLMALRSERVDEETR